MCGIAGIVYFKEDPGNTSLIHQMTQAMAHRGPDADGFFVEPGIALGHRRLAIIDLSEAANQPFSDNSGRYRIIFNGEMYNYAEVKALIRDYDFKTTSDTEVLIAAFAKWGPACIEYFRGMFGFAIWDRQEKEIFLARDRAGVKPLYYFLDEEKLIFASETRSLLATGLIERKLNPLALREYLSYQSVSYPLSMIEGIHQLQAGSWIKVKDGRIEKNQYWDLSRLPKKDFDFENKTRVQAHVRELLLQSVKRRMVSDVPVAAFLSGGIDSSIIVGLMAEATSDRPNSFTISFDEKDFDESAYAGMIAKKFNTHHTDLRLQPTHFLDELYPALDAMDTPSGDGINTFVVSKAIRQNGIKVALSGVGGDELFAGYPFFTRFLQLHKKSWFWDLPLSLRKLAVSQIKGAKKDRLRQLVQTGSCNIEEVYPLFRQILSPERIRELTFLDHGIPITAVQQLLTSKAENLHKLPLLSQVSAAEYLGYTQHTLLKDADQMSMAVSLELREPYFDHDLMEFVLAIPDHIKKPVYPKSLLVESVKPLLPDEIVFRKKQGFLFPWDIWLKKDLRAFCEKHIKNISQRQFINPEALQAYWQSFLQGNKHTRWAEIWLFVVLDYWMEKNNVG